MLLSNPIMKYDSNILKDIYLLFTMVLMRIKIHLMLITLLSQAQEFFVAVVVYGGAGV